MDKEIHFKEDTAKPENRTNLALFGILMVPEVKCFVCTRLKVAEDCVISPCPNLATEEFDFSQRPDFQIIMPLQKNKKHGYIEVELGREDQNQVQRYIKEFGQNIYSIVGKTSYMEGSDGKGDLALEAIYHLVTSLRDGKYQHTQQAASLNLFAHLVHYYVIDGNFTPTNKRAPISEKMASSPALVAIRQYFGDKRIGGVGNVQKGCVHIDTIKENGFSVRIYSTLSPSKGVSIMCRSAGRPLIEFPSLSKLEKYFPYSAQEVKTLVEVVAKLGAKEVLHLPERKRARLPIEVVELNVKEIAAAIEALM